MVGVGFGHSRRRLHRRQCASSFRPSNLKGMAYIFKMRKICLYLALMCLGVVVLAADNTNNANNGGSAGSGEEAEETAEENGVAEADEDQPEEGVSRSSAEHVPPPAPAPFGRRTGESFEGKVVVIQIGQDSLMNSASFQFMRRTVERAKDEQAVAIVLEMDTPGGFLWQTVEVIMRTLPDAGLPVYAFVNNRAISAGAIISLAADKIYMAPRATIGSAAVVTGMGEDLNKTMEAKITSNLIAVARQVAEEQGHYPDAAEAFIDVEFEWKIGDEVISPKGKLLNFNTTEALREVEEGRPLLAAGVVSTVEELLAKENIVAEIVVAEPSGMEKFSILIVRIAPLLILIGMVGGYMELQSPGFGLGGLVAISSFGLYFFGAHVAGHLAGYEIWVLFALGVVLLAVEFFVVPGTLVSGLIGGVLVVGALVMALVDGMQIIDFETGDFDWGLVASQVESGLWRVGFGILAGIIAILVMMRFLPRTAIGRRIALVDALPTGTSGAHETVASGPAVEVAVGAVGTTETPLRPSGRARIDGRVHDVTSDGGFMPKGSAIRVNRIEGLRIVVEPFEEDPEGEKTS